MHDCKNIKRYKQYSAQLKEIFGCKVYKVTLDAGFTCPNRDGTISTGGCIFCEDGGSFSQAHSSELSISEQLTTGIKQLKERFGAQKFISYFQAYSNTYAPVEKLKTLYDEAVSNPEVVGLSIGTRPDCVNEEKIELINSYAGNHEVWIEYGLQSIHNKTLNFINRGHSAEDFLQTYNLTKKYGEDTKICVHVILGLPNETKKDMLETAKVLGELKPDGVKIHMLCVLKNTELEKIYNDGKLKLFSAEEYVETVCDFIELLPPDTAIHRLAGNGLNKILVEPAWLAEKFKILNYIDKEFEKRRTFQGYKYSKNKEEL